ncbi:amino acid adenylation domain-containing protein [Streptomyces fradiae]|uniref:non-ribosomal peptide synthetase n=1 Tax=Streptomyces fradiae TaxID=1906 RepID=UPI003515D022
MTASPLDRLTPAQRAALAARLAGRRAGPGPGTPSAPEPSAPPRPTGTEASGSHPLSLTQYRMWLAEQSAPAGSPAYTVPLALRFTGPLDTERLRSCLRLLAERHLSLRARIVQEGGTPRQRFDRPAGIPLEIRPVPGGPTALAEALDAEAGRAFAYEHPPYVRALLLVLAPEEHVLVLTLHHAVCDGWSLNVLIGELLSAYRTEGAPVLPGPEDRAQHLDYVHWEHGPEGTAELARYAAHWQRQHAGLIDRPDLPFARDTAPAAGEAEPDAELELPEDLARAVHALARRTESTPHAVWLAAFAATWHLLTGVRAVPVGVPTANRTIERFDRAFGAFVSTLPLVLRVGPGLAFAELAERTMEALLEGAAHPVPPLAPGTGVDMPAVTFVFTGEIDPPGPCGPLTVTPVPIRVRGSQGDLTVQLEAGSGRMTLRLTGSPERYTGDGLNRLAHSYLRCLRAVLAAPDGPLATADLRADEDRALTAAVLGATPPAPEVPLPYEAFARWAERTPDAVAVVDATGRRTSYRRLADRAERLAAGLHAAGVRHGASVALRTPPGADYLALTLAVWRLGGWTLPVRAGEPPARLREMLLGAGVRFLVHADADGASGTPDRPGLPELPGMTVLTLRELAESAESAESTKSAGTAGDPAARPAPCPGPAVPVRPGDLAYAVFTSGTTGAPKCVQVPHGALANELAWRRDTFGLAAPDRVLQTIPLAFDPSFWQCFGPLVSGAAVVFPDIDSGARPGDLVDAALAHSATVVDLVPSLLAALTDDDLRRLPARVVFCGGEALPTAQAERYLRLGRGRLHNQYGPSEICIDASSHACRTAGTGSGTVPLGLPLTGVRLYVLDAALRPVPTGAPGELYVGGAGVARGYAGRPAETADRFLPEPAGPPGARMYRTGDRVRRNADGSLAFLGRADHQVKVRGHRVELEEVDRWLRSVDGVDGAAAVVTGARVSRLVAFVTGTPDARAVRAHLAEHLPAHMVPAEIRVLPALPLTANGKADRRALAELARVRQPAPRSGTRPADPVTTAVLEAFATVLDLPVATPDDDLYELGGASLGGARVAAELTRRLGTEVPVRTVLGNPRAADLAAAVTRLLHPPAPPAGSGDPEPEPAGRPGTEQLQVLRQEQVLGRLTPPISSLLALPRPVGPDEAEKAVRLLVDRHEALAPLPGAPAEPDWRPCVSEALPEPPERAHWQPGVADRSVPNGAPGLQATLLTGADGTIRHLILRLARNRGDGASVGILGEELLALLAGEPLPEPAPRYSGYLRARRERRHARSAELEHYWTLTLAGAAADPFAARRPAGRDFRNHGAQREVPAAARTALAEACRNAGITPTAVYLAALARTVARAGGDPGRGTAVIGLPVAHRSVLTEARLVGRTVDLLPVAVPAGDPAGAHSALLAALDHADLPLLRIAELTDPVDESLRPPVCSVGLIVHEGPGDAPVVDDTPPGEAVPEHWSDLDLVLHVHPRPDGGCRLVLSGCARLFGLAELCTELTALAAAVEDWTAAAPTVTRIEE